MNSITLVGTLGKDPELLTATSGNKRARLRLAVTENGGQENEKTHWVDVTAFGTLGENAAASLKKGQRVIAMGRLDTYTRDVVIDGEEKSIGQVAFVASALGPDLRFASAEVTRNPKGDNASGASNGSAAKPAAKKAAAPQAAAADDDDF